MHPMKDYLLKNAKIGNKVKVFLNNNKEIEGEIASLDDEDYLSLKTDDFQNKPVGYNVIGDVEILKSLFSPKDSIPTPEKPVESPHTAVPYLKTREHTVVVPIEKFIINRTERERPAPSTIINTSGSPFSQVDKEITALISEGKHEKAMQKLDENLKKPNIDDKSKSRLLLMKAQLYSTLRDPDNSERIYKELVFFNEESNELKWNRNALGHYYTELARLQAQKQEKLPLALESVKKAIDYNNRNTYAINLLQRLENSTSITQPAGEIGYYDEKTQEEEDLLVEAGENINEISPMLKIDFEEHDYTHPLILKIIRDGGVPDRVIADSLVEQARTMPKDNIGERYLINLEAAKVYQKLAPGSYETSKFLVAAAAYARFKGDSLYYKFKYEAINRNISLDELTRIKDSACSYYLESAKLLSTIRSFTLAKIITNYLKLNIVLYFKKKGSTITEKEFSGEFVDVVKYCLTSKDGELEKIVWLTFVDLGASSPHAWNALSSHSRETWMLYKEPFISVNMKRYYNLINSNWAWNPIDTSLKLKDFLQAAFKERQKLEYEFEKAINIIRKIKFEKDMIDRIIQSWSIVSKYENLLTATDRETEIAIDKAIEIARPYLKRGTEERTEILLGIQNIIEKQIDFINQNTTIYGRTYFFPLLSKWKEDIGSWLIERGDERRPRLEIIIDPEYYFVTDNEIDIPLIIENKGDKTSESCIIDGLVESESTEGNISSHDFEQELKVEIPAGNRTNTSINAPVDLIKYSPIIKLHINIKARYQTGIQAGIIEEKNIQFTLEKETDSNFTGDDIPWDEIKTPPAKLFLGRKAVIDMLCKHYCSREREKAYILYGLTRTGKSSILKYLKEKIDGMSISIHGQPKTIVTIEWFMQNAANQGNASDFWETIVMEQSYRKLRSDIQNSINSSIDYKNKKDARAKDFPVLIECLNNAGYYPLFLVDEFSLIRSLIDKKTISPAFLAVLRELSLKSQAGFLFAGTYDIKELIEEKEYGITGQLVHANNYQVDKIDDQAAEELITVFEKLTFTKEAISHIKKLSGNIPYFIQIICKNCAIYAVENKRHSIGYPELEKVIRILTGSDDKNKNSAVDILPDLRFANNQYDPGYPPNVTALISSIAYLNSDSLENPHGVRMSELERLWGEYKVTGSRPKLADAVKKLLDKRIITQKDDEGDTVYKFSVDLFRRWWFCQYPDIKLALASISEDL